MGGSHYNYPEVIIIIHITFEALLSDLVRIFSQEVKNIS